MRYLFVFSPAIVLLILTIITALGGHVNDRLLVFFLAALTLAVVAAEMARIYDTETREDERQKR